MGDPTIIKMQVRDYINQNILFGDDAIQYSDGDSFLECEIIDSVGIMELILFVEKQYLIDIKDHEVTRANFDSLDRLSSYIQSKM